MSVFTHTGGIQCYVVSFFSFTHVYMFCLGPNAAPPAGLHVSMTTHTHTRKDAPDVMLTWLPIVKMSLKVTINFNNRDTRTHYTGTCGSAVFAEITDRSSSTVAALMELTGLTELTGNRCLDSSTHRYGIGIKTILGKRKEVWDTALEQVT